MMNHSEIAMLLEAWNKVVEYIPQKDRIEAARAYAILIDELHRCQTEHLESESPLLPI